ncbi:hypothetical protein [Catenulispora pinisilvae]|uniref:hypothetical protein n=1 Tax=Catenulispora pinisilvae TaxID=2705253 RepID=UPI001892334A|nr:hypothetical protein [Catenulispora pinisilvae]
MFTIPNSSAMDATAYGGGPGTFVAQIATGSPESIEKLVAQRLKQAEQFLALINQARSATQTLQKAWSGQASETAVKKFTDTLNSFEQIVKVIQTSSTLLTTSSTLIKASQTAYTSVVNAVNPTVAALSSNWWTYSAAVSLSTSVSATLRAFINGIEAMLSALGGGQLMQEVTEVIKIISDIEKLIGSGSHGATVPPAGSFTSPTATGATNQLKTLPQVASTTGQQVAGSGQDPAAAATLSQYQSQMNSGIGTQFQNPAQTGTQTTGTQTGGTMPTGGGVPYTPPGMTTGNGATIPGQNPTGQQYPQGQYPNLNQLLGQQGQNPTTGQYQYPPANQQPVDQNSGWNAVNPSANSDTPVVAQPVSPPVHTAPVAPPAAPPAASATPPGDITVTTTYDGVSTTVTMPVGTQTDVTLVDPTNGSQVHEHIAAGVS